MRGAGRCDTSAHLNSWLSVLAFMSTNPTSTETGERLAAPTAPSPLPAPATAAAPERDINWNERGTLRKRRHPGGHPAAPMSHVETLIAPKESRLDSSAPADEDLYDSQELYGSREHLVSDSRDDDTSQGSLRVIVKSDGTDSQTLLDEDGRSRAPYAESAARIALQVTLPFLIAGLGTVAAGVVLDRVQHWPVFCSVTQLFVLVPALLGLKGNLEMTLASRLSTAANLGHLDRPDHLTGLCLGNLLLTQLQALVVGLLASCVAAVLGGGGGDRNPKEDLVVEMTVLCLSAMLTASAASLVLGGVMIAVVVASRKLRVNPDNIATPIAASLGDLVTISILALSSSALFRLAGTHWEAMVAAVGALVGLAVPGLVWLCYHNHWVRPVLLYGWTPILSAMAISSAGGLILDKIVSAGFSSFAVFSPLINGVGGNLGAIQASRISTHLHSYCLPGEMPSYICSRSCGPLSPLNAFLPSASPTHFKCSLVLLSLVVPGNLLFLGVIANVQRPGASEMTLGFVALFLLASLAQVGALLVVADWLVHAVWRRKGDPDNASIPYLTALGDLLGTALLTLAFLALARLGHPV